MRIAVTGASGLIGSALVPHLRSVGHEVVRLVRRPPAGPDEITWDPRAGTVDLDALQGIDGVVHLAGAGVGDHRWTDDYKRTILSSRVDSTQHHRPGGHEPRPEAARARLRLGHRLVRGHRRPRGGRDGARRHRLPGRRGASVGSGRRRPPRSDGIRVVHPRTGLVVDAPDSTLGPLLSVVKLGAGGSTSGIGGAFGPLIPGARLNLAGRLGSGKQYWSWISLRDEVCALQFLLEQDHLSGPVNLTGPMPVTNAEVSSTLAGQMGRRWLPPIPAFAIKALLGEFSTEILGSARVMPRVLEQSGFAFQDPTIESAIRTALAKG